jgi:hypothetical protein
MCTQPRGPNQPRTVTQLLSFGGKRQGNELMEGKSSFIAYSCYLILVMVESRKDPGLRVETEGEKWAYQVVLKMDDELNPEHHRSYK